jgi:hypothetical protein
MSVRFWAGGVAMMLCAQAAHANPDLAIDPERLKALLPAAWAGVERRNVEVKRNIAGQKNSVAEAYYKGGGSGGQLELVFRLTDPGAYAAKMYKDYGADYLKGEVKNDTQKTLVISGRRLLLTQATASSFSIQTQVGGRWTVELNCMKAAEAQCVDTLGKLDWAKLEQLKP